MDPILNLNNTSVSRDLSASMADAAKGKSAGKEKSLFDKLASDNIHDILSYTEVRSRARLIIAHRKFRPLIEEVERVEKNDLKEHRETMASLQHFVNVLSSHLDEYPYLQEQLSHTFKLVCTSLSDACDDIETFRNRIGNSRSLILKSLKPNAKKDLEPAFRAMLELKEFFLAGTLSIQIGEEEGVTFCRLLIQAGRLDDTYKIFEWMKNPEENPYEWDLLLRLLALAYADQGNMEKAIDITLYKHNWSFKRFAILDMAMKIAETDVEKAIQFAREHHPCPGLELKYIALRFGSLGRLEEAQRMIERMATTTLYDQKNQQELRALCRLLAEIHRDEAYGSSLLEQYESSALNQIIDELIVNGKLKASMIVYKKLQMDDVECPTSFLAIIVQKLTLEDDAYVAEVLALLPDEIRAEAKGFIQNEREKLVFLVDDIGEYISTF